MSRQFITGIIFGIVIGLVVGITILAPNLATHAASKAVLSERDLERSQTEAQDVPDLSSEDAVHWRSAPSFPTDRPLVSEMGRTIAKQLATISNDEIILPTISAKEVVEAERLFGTLASGRIDALYASADIGVHREPALALFGAIPFGPAPEDILAWVQSRRGSKFLTALFEKHNIHPLVCGYLPAQSGGWFVNKLTSVEALQNLKIRADGLGAKVWEKVGAEVVALSAEEIMSSFDQKTLDGAVFSTPAQDSQTGFQRYAKHYYFPGWQNQGQPLLLLINSKTWSRLEQPQQTMIKASCDQHTSFSQTQAADLQFAGLEDLSKQDIVIERYPSYLLDAFQTAWTDVLAEEIRQNKTTLEIWEDLTRFVKTRQSWEALGYLPKRSAN